MAVKRVISTGASKEAALYFDRIFPDDLFVHAMYQVTGGELDKGGQFTDLTVPVKKGEMAPIVKNLMPGMADAVDRVYRNNHLFTAELLLAMMSAASDLLPASQSPQEILENADRQVGLPFKIKDIEGDWLLARRLLARERSRIIRSAGFGNAPTWLNEDIFEREKSEPTPDHPETFLVAMQGLDLVDASKLNWEQICEFRKDKDAQKALRDLRVFFSDELRAKDPDYIVDRLNQLQDENSRVAKLWGFETATKAFGVALENKSIAASGIGLMATILGGAPLSAIAAASLIVPVGRFGLKVAEVALDAGKAKSANPVKYLTMLKKLGDG